jgi:protein-disulfide isomerase
MNARKHLTSSRNFLAVVVVAAFCLGGSRPASAAIPWKRLAGGASLDEKQKNAATTAMENTLSLFDCRGSVRRCLDKPRAKAKHTWLLAEYAVFLASKGLTGKEISKVLLRRRRDLTRSPRKIAVAGFPRLGPEKAPIKIIEFADFRCSHCAKVSPLLEKLVNAYKGKVSVVFMPYPLQPYGPSLLAAQAAMAAFREGKFWKMSKLLFENRGKHDAKGLAELASKAGIASDKFAAAMKDRSLLKLVEKSKIGGMRIGVRGTPTLFFNGRPYTLRKDEKHLRDRIEDELYRLSKGS